MVEQYPDTVTLRQKLFTQDANGDFTEGDVEETTSECRIQPASAKWVNGDNGDRVDYSYTISMPLQDLDYSHGEAIIENKVHQIVRFKNYQSRTKIWIG